MGKIEEYAKRTQILVFAVLGSSGGLAPLPGHYPRIFCICRFFVRRFFGIGVGTPPPYAKDEWPKLRADPLPWATTRCTTRDHPAMATATPRIAP